MSTDLAQATYPEWYLSESAIFHMTFVRHDTIINRGHSCGAADIDESIEAALQLRDRLRDGVLDRTLCCNVFPDGSPDALPHALDQLLGECSGAYHVIQACASA